MNIRERTEEREYKELSKIATYSRESLGRDVFEKECDIRTVFQRDRDRIIHCKAFRRLKDKTQVFLAPKGDHFRTRLTHAMEVSQISRTIARALALNEDLTEAIALGHDLGHTPFGHTGEAVLSRLSPNGFVHSEQSVRVVEVLEKDGEGLNLTKEVRDGIRNHQMSGHPATPEGKVVQLSDKLAYIHHDTDDAKRAGIISEVDVPAELRALLGQTSRSRLDTMVHDVVENSIEKGDVILSPRIGEAMKKLRSFMFEAVYNHPKLKEEDKRVDRMLEAMYQYYLQHPMEMSKEYIRLLDAGEDLITVICDYISGMTDQYAIYVFEELFTPHGSSVF